MIFLPTQHQDITNALIFQTLLETSFFSFPFSPLLTIILQLIITTRAYKLYSKAMFLILFFISDGMFCR